MTSPEPALVARFRVECERLLGAPLGDGRLALAVSGGPDSMAMLALAAAAFPGRVTAATVDHGLRAESADEAAMVSAYCATLSVPHATLVIAEPSPATGNLHAWAREHRYALLLRWAADALCGALLTAHHADYQAETFLMRAARGSGVAGLAGIRATQTLPLARPADLPLRSSALAAGIVSITICRPLLAWRRDSLRELALAAEAPFIDDPSNGNVRFERARVRASLATLDWLDPVRVAAAAAHAAEADEALEQATRLFWRQRVGDAESGDISIDMAGLPREIRRRLARQAITTIMLGSELPITATDNIESLIESLEAGRRGEHGGVLASAKRQIWRFRPAPPRRSH